jgi:hypothetical protein
MRAWCLCADARLVSCADAFAISATIVIIGSSQLGAFVTDLA